VGETVKVHGAACWLILTATPAIVTVAKRTPPLFCCTLTVAAPLPVPVPLAVAQGPLELDDHVHPLAVVTLTVDVPPSLGTLSTVGDTVYAQGGGVPAVGRNCATTGAVRFSAAALFCVAVPVTRPL
jgi:hypothetical protein